MAIGTCRFRVSLVCAIVVTFSLSFQSLYAAGSGSIKGHVFDKVTSEPLIGANVVVLKTSLGGSANIEGLVNIYGVPIGQQTLKISYVGYQTITVQAIVPENGVLEQEFRLSPQAIEGEEVVITAQARGQDAAINQQLASNNIANIVSSARIQELPDANAAESIGRLPGVSLVRNGGEATQIVVRGLEPKYNSITIDGVALPATGSSDRGTDLSMISSMSLEGIEVYKTVTADMDAAAIGGTVNFDIRHAKSNNEGVTSISLLAQGGFNDLMNSYKDYKCVASVEKRFFDDKFGVFVQGIAQRQNLTSDQLSSYYYNDNLNTTKYPDTIAMGYTTLTFIPSIQKRYDGTLTLDYKLPDGELVLLNIVSHGTTTTEQHSEQYTVANAPSNKDVITLGTSLQTTDLNVITNILRYKQTFGSLKIDAKLSNAYSDNVTPNAWYMDFQQQSSGTSSIPTNLTPSQVALRAQSLIDLNKMYWTNNRAWNSFNKQDDKQFTLDVENKFNLSDLVSLAVKGGGAYKYTTRYYNYDASQGLLNIRAVAQNGARQYVIQELPWLQNAPYNLDPTGTSLFPILGFYNSDMNFGKFIKGEYSMYSAINTDVIDKIMGMIKLYRAEQGGSPDQPVFDYDMVQSLANDYSGHEIRGAGYFMATLNVGSCLSIIPGVRYQALRTSYTAAHFLSYVETKISNPFPYTMVTDQECHGYWLPDISIKFDPSDAIGFRASFTNTMAYPDFNSFIPKEDIDNSSKVVVYNNTALKPERARNYDVQVFLHNNTIGLFAVSPFLKTIDDEIYSPGKIYLDTNKVKAYGFPITNNNVYTLTTYINNPYQVKIWGIETEWQTHFWYLPGPLSGLVMNVNYTHIFSQGKFPYTTVTHPTRTTVAYVDTSFIDRLYQQPNDLVNLSIGYDYKKFSILASMIYQSQVFNQSAFWWTLRSDKTKYLRWDLSMKQGLPWNEVELYFDVNNMNKEADIYVIRKNGFPTSEYNYGLTADIGIRWKFN